ncbi:MAG: radical SAM protein [Chloroflexi bacterium]|nr:radical SAM protein [Chloroflexota bacterium]
MSITSIEPGYLALYRSGELQQRAQSLEAQLASCKLCPRRCKVNRLNDRAGYCYSGHLPIVSTVCAHHGEEPVLSGNRGSGTIFFGNCNLRCVYCQNFQISQNWGKQKTNEIDCRKLAEKMLYLQDGLGCHNINLVSPSHFVPQIVGAVLEAVPLGLHVPLVYNTSGYDSLACIEQLDGIISIYLPDLRYASEAAAREYSGARDYVANARRAIREMYRQVGNLVTDEDGVAQRGLIVRLLILPNGLSGTEESLRWLAEELSPSVAVSVMSQYMPMHHAFDMPLLSRTVTQEEFDSVCQQLEALGMGNGWVQELDSASHYLPDFEREGHPFSPDEIG